MGTCIVWKKTLVLGWTMKSWRVWCGWNCSLAGETKWQNCLLLHRVGQRREREMQSWWDIFLASRCDSPSPTNTPFKISRIFYLYYKTLDGRASFSIIISVSMWIQGWISDTGARSREDPDIERPWELTEILGSLDIRWLWEKVGSKKFHLR